jgi:hypothetical protein
LLGDSRWHRWLACDGAFRRSPRPVGIASLRTHIDELTGGTWRPLKPDSYDIATSPWHGVIMDRFVAERGERRLDSHEVVVVAVEHRRIVRFFHYVHDPDGFAAFWSG